MDGGVVVGCDPGWGDCDSLPVDGCEVHLVDDVRHCGACGNACPEGAACVAGACTCIADAFGRPDGDQVGGGWTEVGEWRDPGANCGAGCVNLVSLAGGRATVSETMPAGPACACAATAHIARPSPFPPPVHLSATTSPTRISR